MKVLIISLFVVASVAARGSGPYLPSGWRPTGPAFFLPSEVQKPAENPLQDVILDGSEASGSEALREYGPPKIQELPQGVTNQGLPDVAIEQNFVTAPESLEAVARLIVDEQAVEQSVNLNEAVTVQILEAFTESQRVEEQTESAVTSNDEVQTIVEELSQRSFSNGVEAIEAEEEVTQNAVTAPTESAIAEVTLIETLNDQTTVSNDEIATSVAEQDSTVSTQQESVADIQEPFVLVLSEQPTTDSIVNAEISNIDARIEAVEQIIEIEGKQLEEIVQNIPEIINLDSEVQSNQVAAVQVSSVPESAGPLEQAPEGFLEYGPPGFSEYGPPKEDQLAREAAEGKALELESVSSNETRRRRFSPKFKTSRKAH